MTADWATTTLLVPQNWPESMTPWLRAITNLHRDELLPDLSDRNWKQWQQAMNNHGLLPLLFNWLADLPDSLQPPAAVTANLQQAYLQQVALVAVRHRQLSRLLAALLDIAQPILVLKGAALAVTLYADPALRPATDIDLLVRPQLYASVREALMDAGYRSRKGRRPSQADWAGEEEFVLPDESSRFMVDLHWTLSPFTWAEQPRVLEMLFTRAELTEADGQRISVLATPDALVHAALHLIYANFDNIRLIWVYDIHLLANKIERQDKWPEVFATAAEWYGRLALVDALLLANEWFETPLPPGLTDPDYFPAAAAEWNVYRTVHGPATAQEKLQRLRLATLSPVQRLFFYRDRLLPNSQEIDLGYPRFRTWPYPLKVIGRLSTILLGRGNRG